MKRLEDLTEKEQFRIFILSTLVKNSQSTCSMEAMAEILDCSLDDIKDWISKKLK